MEYARARDRLLNHANLGAAQIPEEESFLHALFLAEKQGNAPSFARFASDILECLAAANLELNGPVPSESSARNNQAVIVELAYALSAIIAGGLGFQLSWSQSAKFSTEVIADLSTQLYLVAVAWDLVLAGDIDDVIGEARLHCGLTA